MYRSIFVFESSLFSPTCPRTTFIIPAHRAERQNERVRRGRCRDHPEGSHEPDFCPLDLQHNLVTVREYHRYLYDFVSDSRSRAASLIAIPYLDFSPNTWELGFIRNTLPGRAEATVDIVLTLQERCYLSHILIKAAYILAADAKVLFFCNTLDECHHILERTIPDLPQVPNVEQVVAEDPEPRPRRR